MQMPVVVGVIVAIILLVAFSGWFFNLVQGWKEFILDDVYFWYRVGSASALSITIMTLTFFGMAYAYECPDENQPAGTGLAAKLNCSTFNKIKVSAEDVFKKPQPKEEPTIDPTNLENQTEEI